jgi:hypothetical protein
MHIPGLQSFADPLQGSIAHIILINFVRRMNVVSNQGSRALKNITLIGELQLFHDQMKHPWGKILNLESNAKSTIDQNQYYALKDLKLIIGIIERENFVKLLLKTDKEFNNLWFKAVKTTNELLDNVSKKDILGYKDLTASTFALFLFENRNQEFNLSLNLIECVKTIKVAWQNIWAKYNATKNAFNYILRDQNSEYIIRLGIEEPENLFENMFAMAINTEEEIRIWVRLNGSIKKSRPSTRALKWIESERIHTDMNPKPSWWLTAIENNNLADILSTASEFNLREDLTNTTIY